MKPATGTEPAPEERSRWTRGHGFALAGVVLAALVVFAPALAGRVVLFRDVPGFTLPSRALVRDALLHFRIPEWNPYVDLGAPILAAPVHGALYPGHLPLLLLPWPAGLSITWFLHVVLGGAGAYFTARALGVRAVSGTLAAVAWMLAGYSVSMWGNGEKVLSDAWIFPSVAAWIHAARAKSWTSRSVVVAALCLAGVALAGDPFLWFHATALAVPLAWAASGGAGAAVGSGEGNAIAPRGSASQLTRSALARVLSRGFLICLGASLLAAPALVPAFALRSETVRGASLAIEEADKWSLHVVRLLELVSPRALGDPLDLDRYPGGAFADAPTVQALPWAISIYVGAAVVALAPLAPRGRVRRVLVALCVLFLVLSLGKHTPVNGALRSLVPPLAYFRYPEKHFLVVQAGLSLLAALGCEEVLARRRSPHLAAIGPLGLGVLAVTLAPAPLAATTSGGLVHGALATTLLVGSLWLACRRASLAPLVIAVATFDLALAAWPLLPWSGGGFATEPPALARTIREGTGPQPPRLLRPPVDHLRVDTLPANVGALFGIGTFPAHEPSRLRAVSALTEKLERDPGRLASLFAIDWVLVRSDDGDFQLGSIGRPLGSTGHPLGSTGHSPRAWIAAEFESGASAADDARTLERLALPEFDVRRRAIVAAQPPAGFSPTKDTGAQPAYGDANECSISRFAAERIELVCTAEQNALVVLSEAHCDGWTVRVDGGPAVAPARVDVALRGAWMPAGKHTVVFEYRTRGLRLGLCLGALGVALLGAILFAAKRRPR